MLGQRYTTPMVTVVCPVTKLHHIASLQSASSCNCTSYAGIVSLIYSNTPPPFFPILIHTKSELFAIVITSQVESMHGIEQQPHGSSHRSREKQRDWVSATTHRKKGA